jgi:Kef-type K+ transport system membrane component KefB
VPESRGTFLLGLLLVAVAMVSKFAAGYAPFWFEGRKRIIGVGMIPRGEVGLIFAQMGLSTGAFDKGVFGAIAMMVIATTFAAPPLLKAFFPHSDPNPPPRQLEGIEDLVT